MNAEWSLEGRGAIVTGGARGIGRAIALELGRRSARVVVSFRRDEAAAREAVDAVRAAGAPEAWALRADATVPAEVEALAEQSLARLGEVDVLVNNAGIQRSAMVHKMTDADWREVFAANVDAAFYLARAVLPGMRARRQGAIVNVASASAFVAQAGAASYVASKHALVGLTKALALESASKNIRVNAVAPGATDTPLLAALPSAAREHLEGLAPLGRVADPEEVARMVAWVLSEATYSTGNVFHVSGGVVMA